MPVKTVCKNCEKEFYTKPHYLSHGKMRCCSMKCRDEYRKKLFSKPCKNCGTIFHPSKNTVVYCSKKCVSEILSNARKNIHPPHLIKKGFDKPNHIPWNKGTVGLSKPNKTSFKPGRYMPRGKDNPSFKTGRRKTKSGYIQILHPTIPGKYIQEHRHIYEQYLGRPLLPTEFIHHVNGIKDDNRIENLELVPMNNHYGKITCPFCENSFFIK